MPKLHKRITEIEELRRRISNLETSFAMLDAELKDATEISRVVECSCKDILVKSQAIHDALVYLRTLGRN